MGTNKENKQFNEFRTEVLKYNSITTDELVMLISRYTEGNMGRRFFNNKLKIRYYSFWIKILHKSGILEQSGMLAWKIKKRKGLG